MNDSMPTQPRKLLFARFAPRWIKRSKFFRFALNLLCLVALLIAGRLAIGIGYATYHYRTTPSIDEFAKKHPVAETTIREYLPSGKTLSKDNHWSISEMGESDLAQEEEDKKLDEKLLSVEIHLQHGRRTLAKLNTDFTVLLDQNWDHQKITIEMKSMEVEKNFHCLVVTSLSNSDELVGTGSMGRGNAVVDLFLLSGSGPNQHRFCIQDSNPPKPTFPLSTASNESIWLAAIFGITCNLTGPPKEGLIHHVRHKIRFDWEKHKDGHGGPSFMFPQHYLNSKEYTYQVTVRHEGDHTAWHETSLVRQWNGKVW